MVKRYHSFSPARMENHATSSMFSDNKYAIREGIRETGAKKVVIITSGPDSQEDDTITMSILELVNSYLIHTL